MHQGDDRFISKLGNMEVLGTSHKEDSSTFLARMNPTLIVTWGNFGLYSSLQGKSHIVVLVSLFGRSLTLVFHFFSPRRFWVPPRLPLNSSLCPLPCLRFAQNLTQGSQPTLFIPFQCFEARPHLDLILLTHRTMFHRCSTQSLSQWLLWTLDILDLPFLSTLHRFPNSL